MSKKYLTIDDIISILPSLDKIKEIILKKLFNRKDLIPLKLIFDIYEEYFKNFNLMEFNVLFIY